MVCYLFDHQNILDDLLHPKHLFLFFPFILRSLCLFLFWCQTDVSLTYEFEWIAITFDRCTTVAPLQKCIYEICCLWALKCHKNSTYLFRTFSLRPAPSMMTTGKTVFLCVEREKTWNLWWNNHLDWMRHFNSIHTNTYTNAICWFFATMRYLYMAYFQFQLFPEFFSARPISLSCAN